MRVDYTLPALQPETLPDLPDTQEVEISFREQLRSQTVQVANTVEEQLRLDERPYTATYIGPPPRPKTLEFADTESQRARWRTMLARHRAGLQAGTSAVTSLHPRSVQMMLQMLEDMQDMEDAIVAQSVSLTRG